MSCKKLKNFHATRKLEAKTHVKSLKIQKEEYDKYQIDYDIDQFYNQ